MQITVLKIVGSISFQKGQLLLMGEVKLEMLSKHPSPRHKGAAWAVSKGG